MFSTPTIIAAAAFFANAVNSHMIMAKPVPFGKPDNSPLSPSGSDYPCKLPQAAGFQGSAQSMPSGSQQTLAFSGTAVHGGGSCQISLTKDSAPTPGSSFKVINSILGGCPGADGSSNTFTFTMPAEVPNGNYVLAWSWFNRIGNREMYMNCAPVSVSGSSGSDSTFSGLPDMAVYNIQLNGKATCATTESTDVEFPNPGKYVTKGAGFKASKPVGGNCGASGASADSGSAPAPKAPASNGAGAGASASIGNGSGSGTQSANNGQYTGEGASGNRGSGSFGEGAAGASSVAASAPSATFATVYTSAAPAAATSVPAAPVAPAPAVGSSSGTGNGSLTGTTTPGGSCSQDGAVVCSADGSQFGLCDWGKVVMMPVAAGTKCTGGQIRRRSIFNW